MVEQDLANHPFASLDDLKEAKEGDQALPAMGKAEAPLEASGIPADAFTDDGILKKPLNAFRMWLRDTTRNQRLAMAGEAGFEHSHTLTLQSRVFKELLDQDTRNAYADQARAQKSLYKERESILKSAGMLDALRPMRKRPSNATADSAKFADDERDKQSDQHDSEEILMGDTAPKNLPLAKRGKGSKASKTPTVLKRAVRSNPSAQLAGKRIKIKGRPSGRPAPTGLVCSQDLELRVRSNALETPRNDEVAIADARRLSSLSAAGVFVNRSSWSPSDLSTSQTTMRGSQLPASNPCWGQIPWANDGTSGSASPGDTSIMAYPTRNIRRASSEPSCMAFEYMFADEPPEPCIDLVPVSTKQVSLSPKYF
ncbi:hypothetical protein IE81DRAFT_66479 [Ceraceosorus guamensis]|uniref:Uncharacterized protein n=1 Tax=Ceraceosorus guamensis TaxID=1522189 RepID=A0A316W7S8_9BASI|nr:hypothetical protein IE81DRAFT_66479 [Ceraceosorus guamensis]PWN43715.1 hypothetical protein IE81DRAFT_66479 [Ceraceosorus guamensis]